MSGQEDFPIICETCLGENPYVRMMRAECDKECKICARPFTVYRWRPGSNARYKKTEICQTCAKLKNVCQTCVLDLQYGLPVQVRDQALAGNPTSTLLQATTDVNREWSIRAAEKEMDEGLFKYGRLETQNALSKVTRNAPYYKRNLAHICSFFVKGTCTRGASCPYRHEIPEQDPELKDQNIKDRYFGKNDPVAKKMLNRMSGHELHPPNDPSAKTLYLGGVTEDILEQDIKDAFYVFGEIQEIRLAPKSLSAFVTFAARPSAEEAASKMSNNCTLRDKKIRVGWARSSNAEAGSKGNNTTGGAGGNDFFSLSGNAPFAQSYIPPNPSLSKPSYPSANPSLFGSKGV
ncbi:hypothetical protein PROFUN_07531 [Planoprotostelium fungivorum]|uniref:Pre-mRNA-splicing factor RBM22 n=1 Tax=Planoprotostelium fungivorum TaxID=1890364 RepID=A0A2P6NLP1_9EUKA|nr:hypothetical protein PROFUN_16101 [Planoprotostelium fungivorum]PRP84877.1 hypothetical protein PROFUN_07531 [Planoprotostelium fungivorum]